MDPPYRRQVARCELCDREVGEGQLASLAGLDVCTSCRAGELQHCLGRWGLRLEPARTGIDNGQRMLQLEVRWSTSRRVEARFSRETLHDRARKKLLGRRDRDVGDPMFDGAVWVEHDSSPLSERLVKEEGVRAAVLAMLREADRVVLLGEGALATRWGPQTSSLALPLVVLAVHMERSYRRWYAADIGRRGRVEAASAVPFGRKICRSCGSISFERALHCPRCGAARWWRYQ